MMIPSVVRRRGSVLFKESELSFFIIILNYKNLPYIHYLVGELYNSLTLRFLSRLSPCIFSFSMYYKNTRKILFLFVFSYDYITFAPMKHIIRFFTTRFWRFYYRCTTRHTPQRFTRAEALAIADRYNLHQEVIDALRQGYTPDEALQEWDIFPYEE